MGVCHWAPAAPVLKNGKGEWTDPALWGKTLPDPRNSPSIEGNSEVTLSKGDVMLGGLDVGSFHDGHSSMMMTGGSLTVSKIMRFGEMTGSVGTFTQTGGDLRALEICVGAANVGKDYDRKTRGEMEVSGGSLLTRHLTLGWGGGGAARLRIVGSKARPIAVLDYFWIGVREKGTPGSAIDLEYEMDADGVTPIQHWNKSASSVALIDDVALSTCRLHITLSDTPPTGDVTLIRLPKLCHGIFTDLPEGSAVRATHNKVVYEWTLTYKGGPQKTDVTLTSPRVIAGDGSATPYTAGHPAKSLVLTQEEVDSGLREMAQREAKTLPPVDTTALRAFPGAEGFGAFTRGGRGGRVIAVTNLNDAGPGSLREALDAKGPRIIIFRVGGVIEAHSSPTIREPFVTVAGQTAPGDGICIRADSRTHADGLVLNQTHDVILRFLRVQTGKGPQEAYYDDGGDCISVYDSTNFIIDHCSTHWGTDETLSCTGAVDLYTVQWSIISEGLNYEKHSMSSILCGSRCTWHHNLFAHARSRNPLFAGQTRCDFRNNVIYDWGDTSGQGNFTELNYAGNYLRPGPSTTQKPHIFISADGVALPTSLYLAGNVMDGEPETNRDNWLAVKLDRSSGSREPLPMQAVHNESAESALAHVLKNGGAILPKRDAADARVMADVENHTGKIIASQEEVGGWPTFSSSNAAPVDSDNDGIPDEWEARHQLNAKDPADAQDLAASGYTWLEEYLNELAAAH